MGKTDATFFKSKKLFAMLQKERLFERFE